MVTSVLMAGCSCSTTKHTPDPLAGWKYLLHVGHSHFDKAVVDDYTAYIQSLPPDEARLVERDSINEYEDNTGQHAVKIVIPLNGTWWEHVLIYDKSDKRIKVIKYSNGGYRS